MSVSIAIHESKNSEKVVKFVTAEQEDGLFYQLLEFTNKIYAKKLIKALKNNQLHGAYLTKTGNLRAVFI